MNRVTEDFSHEEIRGMPPSSLSISEPEEHQADKVLSLSLKEGEVRSDSRVDRRLEIGGKSNGVEKGSVNDEELVARSRKGDKDSYRQLVERYQGRLFSCAFDILKSREDAEDVVQEALVKAYLSLNEFQGKSSFYTWLYRIVYNMSIDYRRRTNRRGGAPLEFDEAKASEETGNYGTNPADSVLRKQQSKKIREVLSEISEEHRRVIVLRELEGMSYEEIANVVGISRGTVMSRLHYARKKLQQALSEFAPFGRTRGDKEASATDTSVD